MTDLAIYGAGGLGREIYCMIKNDRVASEKWNIIGFFDDNKEPGSCNEYGTVLGSMDEINAWTTPLDVVIAIGQGETVKKIVEQINNPMINFPNLICGTSFADHNNFSIGRGNIIKNSSFSCNVHIGSFNLLNNNVAFGHDCNVGDFNTFMPGVRISGEVSIGDCTFFGVGSIVLQQIKISNHTKLGAGSVLMRKPKAGCLYIGVPAKLFTL